MKVSGKEETAGEVEATTESAAIENHGGDVGTVESYLAEVKGGLLVALFYDLHRSVGMPPSAVQPGLS